MLTNGAITVPVRIRVEAVEHDLSVGDLDPRLDHHRVADLDLRDHARASRSRRGSTGTPSACSRDLSR